MSNEKDKAAADAGQGASFAEGTPAKAFYDQCLVGLNEAKTALPKLLAVTGARDVTNTLVPLNDMSRLLSNSAAMASLTQNTHPDAKIREAARACQQAVQKFGTELSLNRELYDALTAVDVSGADADTKRFAERELRSFRRSGVDKDEKTRECIASIDQELTKLGQAWSKTLAQDVRYIELTDPKQLDGLPQDYIKDRPFKDGKLKLSTNYPDYRPFMAYAKDGELRKQLYTVFMQRGGESNAATLKKIVELRHDKAQLLGYANWADYVTEVQMMKSGANAAAFIKRVIALAKKRSDKDYGELLARKKKDDPSATVVQDYEKHYYESRVKTESYAFDPQSIRPYFEYSAVEKGLLDITAEMYDLEYKPASDAALWHASVKAFDVHRDGKKIGRIFLDMHPREGKYKHAAQFTKLDGIAGVQLAEGVLVCNFPDPSSSAGPALMELSQVETMFHEFGHLMHHVLGGNKRWTSQAGVATEWDFVEAPSQMFEEWAADYSTLKRFAKHHKTGKTIPKKLVEQARKASKFGLGTLVSQQMYYASISLAYYSTDPAELDMFAEMKRLQKEITPFPYVEGTTFYTGFGHLNGYSAMYYTYMWSLVLAKDLLKPFLEHGLMNKDWTRRYRDKILMPGGTQDAADLVKDFLGREFSYDAFEEFLTE